MVRGCAMPSANKRCLLATIVFRRFPKYRCCLPAVLRHLGIAASALVSEKAAKKTTKLVRHFVPEIVPQLFFGDNLDTICCFLDTISAGCSWASKCDALRGVSCLGAIWIQLCCFWIPFGLPFWIPIGLPFWIPIWLLVGASLVRFWAKPHDTGCVFVSFAFIGSPGVSAAHHTTSEHVACCRCSVVDYSAGYRCHCSVVAVVMGGWAGWWFVDGSSGTLLLFGGPGSGGQFLGIAWVRRPALQIAWRNTWCPYMPGGVRGGGVALEVSTCVWVPHVCIRVVLAGVRVRGVGGVALWRCRSWRW